ncbi:type II secretion system F family protein [Dermatophilaceae bacterium Soc4.6]
MVGGAAAVLVALAVLLLPRRRSAVRVGLLTSSTPDSDRSPGRLGPLEVDDVAATMVLLAVALRSGCGEVEAIEAVARVSDGTVAAHLRSVSAARRWGVGARLAWTTADPGWTSVARVLAVAARAGIPPSRLLVEASRDQRAAELAALDAAGARVGVLLVAPLGLAFLPAFLLTTVVPLVVALSVQVLG